MEGLDINYCLKLAEQLSGIDKEQINWEPFISSGQKGFTSEIIVPENERTLYIADLELRTYANEEMGEMIFYRRIDGNLTPILSFGNHPLYPGVKNTYYNFQGKNIVFNRCNIDSNFQANQWQLLGIKLSW